MIRADNLFEHVDGGHYCLLIPNAPMKNPATGEWVPGVVYTGPDGVIRSTSQERWDERFTPVAEVSPNDLNEAELMMVRRSNPGDVDFDFLRVFESWHESEMGVTGHMLELAVAAAVQKYEWPGHLVEAPARFGPEGDPESVEITITTEDLQRVVQTYEIERVPVSHGFTIRIKR
jgi:hypothetical protein